MQTNEEIKKVFDSEFDLDNFGDCHKINNMVCDWWLKKLADYKEDLEIEHQKEIKEALSEQRQEARKELVEEIKEMANHVPANLLLNEIVSRY